MKTSYKVLTTAVLVASVLGASASFAAEEDQKTTSKGKVTFEPATGEGSVTPPAEPEKPGKPIFPWDPTDPEGKPQPGGQGPLSIDFASSFDFDKQEIVSGDRHYKAASQLASDAPIEDGKAPETSVPNFVQITDSRGTEAGWTLSVTQEEQFKTAKNKVLTGGVVTLGNTNFYSHSESAAAEGRTEVVLAPGKKEVIMVAKEGTGAGTQFAQWGTEETDNGAESVDLFVPGGTTKYAQEYTTVFNWELSEEIANQEK